MERLENTSGWALPSAWFERFAGLASIFLALGALLYSILFITIVEGASGFETEFWFAVLMVGGLASVPVLVALYGRLREVDPGFALLAFFLGLGAALGGILHGGYELGALITPPEGGYTPGPESVTRGVLRYAVAGLALIVFAWLIERDPRFPRPLAYLGYIGGALLVLIYIGRLFDFITPGDYLSLVPPILYGFVVHPLFYLWVGWLLWRGLPVRAPAAVH
jgi:hypothetical protein